MSNHCDEKSLMFWRNHRLSLCEKLQMRMNSWLRSPSFSPIATTAPQKLLTSAMSWLSTNRLCGNYARELQALEIRLEMVIESLTWFLSAFGESFSYLVHELCDSPQARSSSEEGAWTDGTVHRSTIDVWVRVSVEYRANVLSLFLCIGVWACPSVHRH